jgi:hypothetical protein
MPENPYEPPHKKDTSIMVKFSVPALIKLIRKAIEKMRKQRA